MSTATAIAGDTTTGTTGTSATGTTAGATGGQTGTTATGTTATGTQTSTGSGIAEPWAKDWIKPDFTLNHTALDRLPDHLKPLKEVLGRQKSFEDVLVVMQNQQVLNGKKALAPLPDGSPAHVMAERKALLDSINGVPPEAKDYGFAKPADLPDGQWDPKMAEAFSAWAHKHSVSPAAAKELLGLQVGNVQAQLGAQAQYEQQFWQQQDVTFNAALKQSNIPADRAAALVEKGAIALGLDVTNEATKTLLKGSDARLMAMRHALAVGEDTFVQGGNGASAGPAPGEAAKDIMHNKANPLYNAYWNRDGSVPRGVMESARAKVDELLRLDAAKNPAPNRQRR